MILPPSVCGVLWPINLLQRVPIDSIRSRRYLQVFRSYSITGKGTVITYSKKGVIFRGESFENFNSLIDKLLTLNCSIWAQRLMKSGQLSDRKIFQPLILKFLLLRRWWSTESDQQSTKFFILLVNLIAQLISKTLGKLLGWNLPERYFRGNNSKTRPNLFD